MEERSEYPLRRLTLERNEVQGARDGFYIQSSPHGVIRGNVGRDLRYGLHYMFSDDNVFEENVFRDLAAGAAIVLYDSCGQVRFEGNAFVGNLTPLDLVGRRNCSTRSRSRARPCSSASSLASSARVEL